MGKTGILSVGKSTLQNVVLARKVPVSEEERDITIILSEKVVPIDAGSPRGVDAVDREEGKTPTTPQTKPRGEDVNWGGSKKEYTYPT